MDAKLYERFLDLKNGGKKVEAKAALTSFLASFETPEEKEEWVFAFLEKGEYGHRIRHEIYKELVFPVLLDGYLKHDFDSTLWLARTVSNLYQIKPVHLSLLDKTEFVLLKEAYALKPEETIRAEMSSVLMRWFFFSDHEWPAGILYGMDGADLEECTEILHEVEYARQLDHENDYVSRLSEFESRVKEYMARLGVSI